jgi:histidinol-phosphate/aromatic aminotransferase/cobyric acid decarboxylase-like protein
MSDALPLGPHGGDGAAVAAALGVPAEEMLDLSASLNPVAPHVGGLAAKHLDELRRYPDETTATAALAEALDADAERVVLTNGGAEAIALVAALLPVGRVDEPDFSLYAHHLCEQRADAHRWRSNPHNPSGRLAGAEEKAAVWDEAFYQLATGRWTRGEGEVTIGSLTKLYACPGLRIGYVVCADPELAARLRQRKPRWSLNALACALVPELLALADLGGWAQSVATLRAELIDLLAAHGLRADPSDANFVLVREAPGVRDWLAPRGVLVRDTTSFGLPDGARIAVPDPHGLEKLANALGGCFHESI